MVLPSSTAQQQNLTLRRLRGDERIALRVCLLSVELPIRAALPSFADRSHLSSDGFPVGIHLNESLPARHR
jgi:hypothetical protein